ncbi:hypothetical protein D9M68_851500 [compost metagenome]
MTGQKQTPTVEGRGLCGAGRGQTGAGTVLRRQEGRAEGPIWLAIGGGRRWSGYRGIGGGRTRTAEMLAAMLAVAALAEAATVAAAFATITGALGALRHKLGLLLIGEAIEECGGGGLHGFKRGQLGRVEGDRGFEARRDIR